MPPAPLSMTVRAAGDGVRVLDIDGDITAASEQILMETYNQATQPGVEAVILNFERLAYMNSSGIGLLVTMLIRAQRNSQQLSAYGLTDHYRQIFSLTRLDEAIHLYPDEEAALAAG